MSKVTPKNQVKVIQARMKELGYDNFNGEHAYEILATLLGESSWNVASAKLKRGEMDSEIESDGKTLFEVTGLAEIPEMMKKPSLRKEQAMGKVEKSYNPLYPLEGATLSDPLKGKSGDDLYAVTIEAVGAMRMTLGIRAESPKEAAYRAKFYIEDNEGSCCDEGDMWSFERVGHYKGEYVIAAISNETADGSTKDLERAPMWDFSKCLLNNYRYKEGDVIEPILEDDFLQGFDSNIFKYITQSDSVLQDYVKGLSLDLPEATKRPYNEVIFESLEHYNNEVLGKQDLTKEYLVSQKEHLEPTFIKALLYLTKNL